MIIIDLDSKAVYKNAIESVIDIINDGALTWDMAARYLDSLHKLANGENDGMITEFCKDSSIAWIYPDIVEFHGDTEITLIFKHNGKTIATVGSENIIF